jgi:hypothetical protein
MKKIDQHDFIERTVFIWCVYFLVPARHLSKNDAHVVFYESLLTDSENQVETLFRYLNRKYNKAQVENTMKKASKTNALKRDFKKDHIRLINGWKDTFSIKQIQRTNYILSAFGLGKLYDNCGYPTCL